MYFTLKIRSEINEIRVMMSIGLKKNQYQFSILFSLTLKIDYVILELKKKKQPNCIGLFKFPKSACIIS